MGVVSRETEIVYVICQKCCQRLEHPVGGGGRMGLYYIYLRHCSSCVRRLVSYGEFCQLKLRRTKVLKKYRKYKLSDIISDSKLRALARRVASSRGLEMADAIRVVKRRFYEGLRKGLVLYGCKACGRPITLRMAQNGGLGVRCRQEPSSGPSIKTSAKQRTPRTRNAASSAPSGWSMASSSAASTIITTTRKR